ncbi:hypothetical protein NFI96_024743, partial [Prochilodus magdalenae]
NVLQLLESHPHCSSQCPWTCYPSSILINGSLSSGHVSQAFQTARVVSILKTLVDTSDISGYRSNQLRDINQCGFKPAHSTETALIAVTEASDILTDLGITATAWKWFESYLEDHHYQVTWKGYTSAPCRLSSGVPQGLLLGPLRFSLYTFPLAE